MPIRPLPTLLVNQIAAGEVIERPASVVKELTENAIDAGATRIEVDIEHGGRDLIRIVDDGCGIPRDELELAIAPHATSKISRAEDLDAIGTLGFRGEALASIGSVSRLSLLSRPHDCDEAAMLEVEGDARNGPKPASGSVGTTITVRNLFHATPARRKFLRSDQTETGRVTAVVESIAISHPGIGFRLRTDGRVRLELPPEQTPRRRAVAVLGKELDEHLLELQHDAGDLTLWGLVGTPDIARPTAKHLRVYLNGRPIHDRAVTHALREAYRGLIAPDRYPTVVLMMEMTPDQVDVNVHPAKAEVRFRQPGAVHEAVRRAIKRRLAEADLVPEVRLDRAAVSSLAPPPPAPTMPFGSGVADRAPAPPRPAGPKGFDAGEMAAAMADPPPPAPAPHTVEVLPTARVASEALQVHDKYIITEDDEGLVIIDQHALHERVMFEKLRTRIAEGTLSAQRLLMPATVEVDASQMESLEALQPLLQRLGIEAEPIGPRSIAIHAFTSLLFERRVEPAAFMTELLANGRRLAHAKDSEGALHEVLDMMSCKAAIKAGDHLAPREITELLAWRDTIDRSSRCPHGRPTTLRLTLGDLDRQFGRS